jgi:1,2-phenylacetyl-CoA epoxidase PaaB subunit
VPVWDVFGKRKPDDQFEWAGSIKASDLEMALVLARETHFRHKEGVAYAVRRRGEEELHVAPYEGDVLGGVTDRSYRRQEAYTGVGRRHREVSRTLAARGLAIDRPTPPAGRLAAEPRGRVSPRDAEPQAVDEVPPEEIAAQGTGG